jgi:serine/threonine-protein kinase
MLSCLVCSASVPEGSATCPTCGSALGESRFGTTLLTGDALKALAERPKRAPRPHTGELRFVPGAVLAARYRIVGLLGQGGMGEVYRADDLKLGQAVALKFLPTELANDGAAMSRFHKEVSLARQVSHPNVCRVFDVGEVDGQPFLSMEFIDGEDLAFLLRRIGRLPPDKSLEISRQLCAGLAAIHDSGVLHRDLKPANVMIDGRGRARITDFGVAALAAEMRGGESATGTPAYMAPEQATRGETTVRSDVYSLGLVLYEMFTGRRAFPDPASAEARQQSGTRPPSPAGLVPDVDPETASNILRCLERDPGARPGSALMVAAGLPGGDPLAAALAAGETPSPEMVAAAPKAGSLRPGRAALCLAGVVLGLLAIFSLSEKVQVFRQVPFDFSPEVLADRAQGLLKSLGYQDVPLDDTHGFELHKDYNAYIETEERAGRGGAIQQRLREGRPPLYFFWYRQSPAPLVPVNLEGGPDDPPLGTNGEALVILDPEGRLYKLKAVPHAISPSEAASPDWRVLLGAAGFDPARLVPAVPSVYPPVFADSQAAWTGVYPGTAQPPIPVRIEAAAYRGKAVFFEVLEPWDEPAPAAPPKASERDFIFKLYLFLYGLFFVSVLVTALLLARRNLRLARGDRRGAWRLAVFIFANILLGWILGANHAANRAELDLLFDAFGWSLVNACELWVFYIGLEPSLRRHWPETIISWSRLLAGHFKDSLVGRDLLVGCLLGLGVTLTYHVEKMLAEGLRGSTVFRQIYTNPLLGVPGLAKQLSTDLFLSILMPLSFMVFLLMLRILFQREKLAVIALWTLLTAVLTLQAPNPMFALGLAFSGLRAALFIFAWIRFGLLAGIAGQLVRFLSLLYPLTTDFSAWYSGVTVFVATIVLSLALYGFSTSVAGQPLFRGGLLDDD